MFLQADGSRGLYFEGIPETAAISAVLKTSPEFISGSFAIYSAHIYTILVNKFFISYLLSRVKS